MTALSSTKKPKYVSKNKPAIDIWKILVLIDSYNQRNQEITISSQLLEDIKSNPSTISQDVLSSVLDSLEPTILKDGNLEVDSRYLKFIRNAGALRLEVIDLLNRVKDKQALEENMETIRGILDVMPKEIGGLQAAIVMYAKVLDLILPNQLNVAIKHLYKSKLEIAPCTLCNRLFNISKIAYTVEPDKRTVIEELIKVQQELLSVFDLTGHTSLDEMDDYYIQRICLWNPSSYEDAVITLERANKLKIKYSILFK